MGGSAWGRALGPIAESLALFFVLGRVGFQEANGFCLVCLIAIRLSMEWDLRGHQRELREPTSQDSGTQGCAQHSAGPLASTNQKIKMEIRTVWVLPYTSSEAEQAQPEGRDSQTKAPHQKFIPKSAGGDQTRVLGLEGFWEEVPKGKGLSGGFHLVLRFF